MGDRRRRNLIIGCVLFVAAPGIVIAGLLFVTFQGDDEGLPATQQTTQIAATAAMQTATPAPPSPSSIARTPTPPPGTSIVEQPTDAELPTATRQPDRTMMRTPTPTDEGDQMNGGNGDMSGGELVQERCTVCHSIERIQNASKTRDQWIETVDRMIGYGAQLTDEERLAVIAYLVANYGAPVTRTPTPPPTASPAPSDTPDAEFTQVAMIPVEVADISGAVIARGIARLYAPQSLAVGETDTVKLELELTRRVQTPTPAALSEDGDMLDAAEEEAVQTAVSVIDVLTPTQPRLIAITPVANIREKMGATLDCLPDRFVGCPEADTNWANNRHFLRINQQLTTWTWPLEPLPGTGGDQHLTAELWWLDESGFRAIEWSHPFTIRVGDEEPGAGAVADGDSGGVDLLFLALLAGGVSVAGGAGVAALRWRRRVAQTTQPGLLASIFISYRREGGWATANMLHDRLSSLGSDVFLDTHSIHEGRFSQIIQRAIAERDAFVVVLAPNTLDSEWVVRETALAIQLGKTVIPVMIDGFTFENVTLPEAIATLSSFNGVRLDHQYLDASIRRLVTFVTRKPDDTA